MNKTSEFFEKGKLSVALDGGAGSSGKGKIGAYLVKNSGGIDFVCNTFTPNASHTIVEVGDNGNRIEYVYKNLNSCAHYHHLFRKMFIGHGSAIHVESLLKEIKQSGLPIKKLGIAPTAMVVTEEDARIEKGEVSLDGKELVTNNHGTIKTGTTASGSGAVRAKKVLRKKNLVLARDVPELKPFLCNVSEEIMNALDNGARGLLEIAQGFQLSYGLSQFYPYTTSRNCSVSGGFDDLLISPKYLGNVLINFRTFPIRIHSKKYISTDGDRHLTWDEVQSGKIPYTTIESYSGDWYDDQKEITWDEVTVVSGSPTPLMECTTLTKLPRRVATFSKKNLEESIRYNQTNSKVFISLNFVNYVDWNCYKSKDYVSEKIWEFIRGYIHPVTSKYPNVELKFLGTSEFTDDTIMLKAFR